MEYNITDLLKLDKLQQITDDFHVATGLSTSLVDRDGKILTNSGWQEICNRFHQANEKTASKCLKSATEMEGLLGGKRPRTLHKCPNGLFDAMAPVIVDGCHVATFFTGQFLLVRPDIPDIEKFSSQARFAGFDETDYLNALEKVPTVTPAKLDEILESLKSYVEMISDMGLTRKKMIEKKPGVSAPKHMETTTIQ